MKASKNVSLILTLGKTTVPSPAHADSFMYLLLMCQLFVIYVVNQVSTQVSYTGIIQKFEEDSS